MGTIPNLIDPRMLSQVGVAPPLQETITPVALPATPPPTVSMPPPTFPTGMGTDMVLPTVAPRPTPPAPTLTQTLIKAIPMLLAGIVTAKTGPPAVAGMLGGYADAMEKRRLLEEKQHEFDVETAATAEERQM